MLMGLKILSLKKAAGYASFRMLMGISGKDPAEIYKLSHSTKSKELRDLAF